MVEAWIVIFFYFVLATTAWSLLTWAWVYLRSALRGRRAQNTTTSPETRSARRLARIHDAPGGAAAYPRRRAARIAIAYGVIDLLIVMLCVVAYLTDSNGLLGELIAYGLIFTLVHVGLCWALQYSKRKKMASEPLPRIQ